MKKLGYVIVMLLLATILIPTTASASYDRYDPLYDTDDPELYEFQINLYQNESLSIKDNETEFAVECIPYDGTSTEQTFHIDITLDDGTTTNTYTITIDALNTASVWGNVLIDPSVYEANNSASLTFTLKDAGMVELDSEEYDVGIYRSTYGGYFQDAYMIVILAGVIVIATGAVAVMAKKTKK